MVIKCRSHFVYFGCLLLVIAFAASSTKASKVSPQELSICPGEKVDTLRRLGAKQLDSSGTKFELEDGTILSLTCNGRALAAVQVMLTKDDSLGNSSLCGDADIASESQHCCFSKLAYDNFIGIINQLKPLGHFERQNPLGVIGPAGWARKTDEFTRASVVRLERTCAASDSAIAAFTVFYWLPLSGEVERKRVDTIEVGQLLKKVRHLITIDKTEVEISGLDYQRIREGQLVKLETTVNNNLARIVAIKTDLSSSAFIGRYVERRATAPSTARSKRRKKIQPDNRDMLARQKPRVERPVKQRLITNITPTVYVVPRNK